MNGMEYGSMPDFWAKQTRTHTKTNTKTKDSRV